MKDNLVNQDIKTDKSAYSIGNNSEPWLTIPADGGPITFTGNADDAAREFFNGLIRERDGYIANLKADRDAALNAERIWEKAMMEVCGEDGPASVAAVIKALAAENAGLFASVGEVYAAGYNHGHLNTVDGIAYTEGVEGTFFERGAQVLAESADLTASNNTYVQLEVMTAENVSMKSAITTHSQSTHFCELCGKDDPCSTDDVCYVLNETPATDAALAAIEAQGVEKFAEATIAIGEQEEDQGIIYAGKQAMLFAKQLREAK